MTDTTPIQTTQTIRRMAQRDQVVNHLRRQRASALAAAAALAERGSSGDLPLRAATELEGHLLDLDKIEARLAHLDKPEPAVRVRSEALTYRADVAESFFVDLLTVEMTKDANGPAARRLEKHRREMQVELELRRERAHAEFDRRAASGNWQVEYRANPSADTPGQGGNFAPPLWLIDKWATIARAGRPLADLIGSIPLPRGVQSVNVPRITTGPTTAVQAANNAAVSMTDLAEAGLKASVSTVSGKVDAARQLLDQAPAPGFDAVIFAELTQDYNGDIEGQLVRGAGSAGEQQGLLGVSGINAVTYTDASPTGSELFAPLGQAGALVGDTRLLPPEVWLMTPRRWFWLASQPDTSGRPLFPEGGDLDLPEDAMAGGVRPVGPVLGLPVFMDGSIPMTLGGGSNEDRIIATRPSDHLLWESELQVRVLNEVLAGTLQVRIDLHAYVAFLGTRYPSATAVISGTGLAAPAGF